jgi:SAM-dependent methyltransferase
VPEGRQHYFDVGRSAMEIIAEAMVLARRTSFQSVLEIPCGGGRVTRHLVKFLPGAGISVSDVEKTKQSAVAAQFGVEGVDIAADFSEPIPRRFDLIFVGSLLTHLQEHMFVRLLDYCIDALAQDGVLIATTAGRWNAGWRIRRKSAGRGLRALRWAVDTRFRRGRATFLGSTAPSERYKGTVYGACLAPASWIVRQVEMRGDAIVLGIKEAAWGGNQDALIVQKCGDRRTELRDRSALRAILDALAAAQTKLGRKSV